MANHRRADGPARGVRAGAGHVLPYPFAKGDAAVLAAAGVSSDLLRSLMRQRALFDGLPGKGAIAFVPVDLTLPGDGWEPADYGYDALVGTLQSVAPAAVVASLRNLHGDASDRLASVRTRTFSVTPLPRVPPICGPWPALPWCRPSRPSSSTRWV